MGGGGPVRHARDRGRGQDRWLPQYDDDDYFEAYADPNHDFERVLDRLLDEVERRAHATTNDTGEPVVLETDMSNETSRSILESRGFVEVGGWYKFIAQLELIPPEPTGGPLIRSYVPGEDDDVFYRTLAEGFGNDWDEPPASEFLAASMKVYGYTPDLWLLAESGGEVVGALQGFDQWTANADIGWVRKLAVLPGARGQGIGHALLLSVQQRFSERGKESLFVRGREGQSHGCTGVL